MKDKTAIKACSADSHSVQQTCWMLGSMVEPDTSRKGVVCWNFINIKTRKFERVLYGVKSKAYPNGIIFNYCPFCGEKHPGGFKDAAEEESAA